MPKNTIILLPLLALLASAADTAEHPAAHSRAHADEQEHQQGTEHMQEGRNAGRMSIATRQQDNEQQQTQGEQSTAAVTNEQQHAGRTAGRTQQAQQVENTTTASSGSDAGGADHTHSNNTVREHKDARNGTLVGGGNSRRSSLLHPAALRVYVADIPEKFTTDVIDKFSKLRAGGECDVLDTTFWGASFAAAMGERVQNAPFEMRYTNQFDLDMWLYTQLLQSPLRVHTFEEADIVFVPALFARINRWCWPAEHDRLMEEFLSEYPTFLPDTDVKPHVIGYARPGWDIHVMLKNDTRSHPFTWTVIEAINHPGYSDVNQRLLPLPYPAHFHWSRGSGHYYAKFDAEALTASKTMLASETFVSRLEFRKLLKSNCQQRPAQCIHAEFREYTENNEWDPESLMASWNLTASSWYCLQPPGDTFTRRAFYDCLLADSIPVVFDESYFMYHQFQEFIEWQKLLVYIPQRTIEEGHNVIDLLMEQHSEEQALEKLAAIHEVRHLLQYSLNPVHELVRFDLLGQTHREDDAFSVGMRTLMVNLCERRLLPEERCNATKQHSRHRKLTSLVG